MHNVRTIARLCALLLPAAAAPQPQRADTHAAPATTNDDVELDETVVAVCIKRAVSDHDTLNMDMLSPPVMRGIGVCATNLISPCRRTTPNVRRQ